MIPTFYTNNTTPVNIRPNAETTQEGQASTNTSLTTTNFNNSFTVAHVDNPRPRNMITNPLATFAIGIGILCRYVAPAVAETTESILTSTLSNLNVTTSASSINSTAMLGGLYTVLGVGCSFLILFLLYKLRINYQQGIREPLQPRITEAEQRKIDENNLINKFCKLEYKNLPLVEIDIAELKETKCTVCLAHIDNNASLTSLNTLGSNGSIDTKEGWVIYKEQFYHLNDLQEAVAINRKVPHTQEEPEISELKAVKILYKPNDTTIEIAESTAKKPESFIVDVPKRQDTSQFPKNDNDEESTAFLETAF